MAYLKLNAQFHVDSNLVRSHALALFVRLFSSLSFGLIGGIGANMLRSHFLHLLLVERGAVLFSEVGLVGGFLGNRPVDKISLCFSPSVILIDMAPSCPLSE